MSRWADVGDGEYRCTLNDGREVKVFNVLLWYVAVDDRMVDDVFFGPVDAMRAVDAWQAGAKSLTFHPTDRRWRGSDSEGYSRQFRQGELTVTRAQCGSWKINRAAGRCFSDARTARRYADERLH